LFIDDKPENLVEPTNLGWKTVCFKQEEDSDDGIQRINELLNNG
jgi:FMN phosphatase YigB (HAD superfamily)